MDNMNNTPVNVARIYEIMEMIKSEDYSMKSSGEYCFQDGTKYKVQEYSTKEEVECKLESHRNHIDVQYIVEGCEQFKMYNLHGLIPDSEYNKENDVEFWRGGTEATISILVPGSFIVVYNGQPHKGAIKTDEIRKIKKIVCKIDC